MTEGLAPPGWPVLHVLPPGIDGWKETATAWLFDWAGVAQWREIEVLTRFPVVLARMVAQHMDADVSTARRMWVEIDGLVDSAGVAVSDQETVAAALRSMLEREGSSPRTWCVKRSPHDPVVRVYALMEAVVSGWVSSSFGVSGTAVMRARLRASRPK